MKSKYFVLLLNDTCCCLQISQPSRKKRKSYVENFVIAQCACFNDEVTLTQHVICLRRFLVFLT